MKSYVAIVICIFTALLFLQLTTIAQSVVPFPAWATPSSPQYAPAPDVFVPPGYTGPSARAAKFFLVGGRVGVFSHKIRVSWSPNSGIIAISDINNVPANSYGWDTGMDRVYSCRVDLTATISELRLLVTGWENGSSPTGNLFSLKIVPASLPTQAIIKSETNAIWVAPGVVGGRLYFFDIQSHSCRRIEDSNNDGTFDLLDPSFDVPLPTSVPPGSTDPFQSLALRCPLFWGFTESWNGVVNLDRSNGVSGVAEKDEVAILGSAISGYFIAIVPIVESGHLDIGCYLVVGQDRVRVVGPKGQKFRIMQIDSAGAPVQVSNDATIPIGGVSIVGTRVPLHGNGDVYVMAVGTGPQVGNSAPVSVGSKSAVLFLNRDFWHQNKVQKVEHFGLPKDARIFCRRPGVTEELKVMSWDAGRISVRLPSFGTATAIPPFQKFELCKIWAVNKAGTTVLSPSIRRIIMHN